jgi:hypothetical protein
VTVTEQLQMTVLIVGCDSDAPGCAVRFEPEGSTHALPPGASLRVEAVHPPGYEIEVSYGPDSITLWAEQTWGTRAFTSDGRELKL